MKSDFMRAIFILSGLLLFSACSMIPPVAAVEGVTAVATGKPLSDHILSISSGKHCSIVRSNEGRSYCEEDEVNPTPDIWCYKTLGNVSCYDRPNPYHGHQRRTGETSYNTRAK